MASEQALCAGQISKVDGHDGPAVRAWYDAMRAGMVVGRAAPLLAAYEEMAVSLRDPSPTRSRDVYAARVDGTVVATLLLERPLVENRHVAEIEVSVPPEHRRRGYGSAMLAHGLALAATDERSTLMGEVYVPDGQTPQTWPGPLFAARHGFTSQHEEDHLILDLPVPADTLTALAARAAARHAGYQIVSWTNGCPPEYAEDFVVMRNVMERDVPIGELDLEPSAWDLVRLRAAESRLVNRGFTSLVAAARDASGTFAGYSELLVPAHTPDEVYQEDTLVMAAHRGHRLGAALKAHNLTALQRDFGGRRLVHTWTAGTNAAMRTVNAAFGFHSVERLHEYQRITR